MKNLSRLILFMAIILLLGNKSYASSEGIDQINKNIFTNKNFFHAYQFIVVIVKDLPVIKLEFVRGIKQENGKFKVKIDNILAIRPKVSLSEEGAIIHELEVMKNFVPMQTKENNASMKNDGENERSFKRYDSFDQNDVMRISQWFDSKTLFRVKFAEYNESAKLLFFSFYSNLEFDDFFEGREVSNKKNNLRLEDILKDQKNINFTKISNLEKFCHFVLEQLLKNDENQNLND